MSDISWSQVREEDFVVTYLASYYAHKWGCKEGRWEPEYCQALYGYRESLKKRSLWFYQANIDSLDRLACWLLQNMPLMRKYKCPEMGRKVFGLYFPKFPPVVTDALLYCNVSYLLPQHDTGTLLKMGDVPIKDFKMPEKSYA